ncbi:MAG: ATP-binding protein [Nitrospirota bacterium]|nr:ATP-binding protein [Nitrospirota bacterium]
MNKDQENPVNAIPICRHKNEDNTCPISKMACPGICIFSEILTNVDVGIIVLDISKKAIIFKNNHAERIFNIGKSSIKPISYETFCCLCGFNCDDLIESSIPIKHSINHGDKILGYTAYSIAKNYVWVFVQDITERNKLESIAMAVETMNHLGYIVSGIRHEIGNPLNSLRITIDVLLRSYEKFSLQTNLEYLTRAADQVNRIEHLLESLKNFNLFEKPRLGPVHIVSFLRNVVSLVSTDFESEGLPLELDIADIADEVWGFVDPRALQQVMLNILTNAADAVKGRNAPSIVISARKLPGSIKIDIIDNGCGIPKNEMKNLFRAFYTTKSTGTGLGLVVSKKMLASMNCLLDVTSLENIGTTVTISIPRYIHDAP